MIVACKYTNYFSFFLHFNTFLLPIAKIFLIFVSNIEDIQLKTYSLNGKNKHIQVPNSP